MENLLHWLIMVVTRRSFSLQTSNTEMRTILTNDKTLFQEY